MVLVKRLIASTGLDQRNKTEGQDTTTEKMSRVKLVARIELVAEVT